MAARALWKGAISFGLVNIPVEMHSAVQEHELDLTMLDRRDFAPVGYKRYNKSTGKDITWDDIIKGYEYQDNEYVVLSDEDLKRANVEATQTIDIQAFVDAADVPLTYYQQPYYLTPQRGGGKVYTLLRETLRKAGKIGIATVVLRTKQHLCALVCIGDQIVLNTLRYPQEIRETEDMKLPPKSVISPKELQMALSLVEGMSEEWKPEEYHDTYKDDVLALVKKKIKAGQTKTITAAEPESKTAKSSNVIDLVSLLQNSLGKRPAKGGTKSTEAAETGEAADTEAEDKPAAKASVKSIAKPAAKAAPKTAAKATTKAKTTARAATTAAAKAAPAKRRQA